MSEETPGLKEEARGSTLQKVGLALTALYVISVFGILLVGYCLGWVKMEPLGLNEIGDFLAGVFGPLAITWLVLGFMQQGSELRLQVTELANSVAQQKEMVNVSRETLDHERGLVGIREAERKERARPKVTVEILGKNFTTPKGLTAVRLRLTNIGSQLSEVKMRLEPAHVEGDVPCPTIWITGGDENFRVRLPSDELGDGITLLMSCQDVEGERHSLVYFSPLKDDDKSELRLLSSAVDTASSGGT